MSDGGLDPKTGLGGEAAPPRDNGELVFTAPWQSRLFATTMALRERELLAWEPFRQALIDHIADHTASLPTPEAYDYWGCWQSALEERLAATGLVKTAVIDERSAQLAARPAGHDHDDHDQLGSAPVD